MNPVAKWFIFGGLALVVVGLLWQVIGKYIPLGRLPGDFVFGKDNVRVYFPFVSMLIISILLSILFSLGRFLR